MVLVCFKILIVQILFFSCMTRVIFIMRYEQTIVQKCFAIKIHVLQFLYRVIQTNTCIAIADCLKTYFENYLYCDTKLAMIV